MREVCTYCKGRGGNYYTDKSSCCNDEKWNRCSFCKGKGDIIKKKEKLEIDSFNIKELNQFMEWVVEGNKLGKKKYDKTNFVKDNMFEFLYSELRDSVNYLFFLYKKIRLLEENMIKYLPEKEGTKKLR